VIALKDGFNFQFFVVPPKLFDRPIYTRLKVALYRGSRVKCVAKLAPPSRR